MNSDMTQSVAPPDSRLRALMDVVGIILLPLACFSLDYAINGLVTQTTPVTVWVFAATGMGAFVWSGRLQPGSQAVPFVRGMLAGSSFGALFVGLVLLPFSIVFSIIADGLGLLGLTPIWTACLLFERQRRLGQSTPRLAATLVGFSASFLPALIMLSLDMAGRDRWRADFLSGNSARVERALRHSYKPSDFLRRDPSLASDVCASLDRIPIKDPAVESALRDLIGQPIKPLDESCAPFLASD